MSPLVPLWVASPPGGLRHLALYPYPVDEDPGRGPVVRAVVYYFDEDVNTEGVMLADNADEPGWTLDFQRALRFDAQDVARGEDTDCVVLDSGPTVYGGVEALELAPGELRLTLGEEAVKVLEVEERDVTIVLDLDEDGLVALAKGLRKVLGDAGGPHRRPLPLRRLGRRAREPAPRLTFHV